MTNSTMVLRIEIIDDSCAENEAIWINVPLDTLKTDIVLAIETLYPTCRSLYMFASDSADGTTEE